MKTRRNFLKKSIGVAAGIGILPTLAMKDIRDEENLSAGINSTNDRLPLLMEEKSIRLAFFDPAEGAVQNPGMGISGFVHSDHMTANYPGADVDGKYPKGLLTLDRKTFDYFASLPYNDNLYMRYEWRDIQKDKGKLAIPDSWKWTLEASEKYGKRWSFRIMNFMPQSTSNNGLPEFLQGKFKMTPYFHKTIEYGKQPYYFPEYSNELLDYWDELNYMLAEKFDNHPNLEYVDVSGFGLWGEFHHWLNLTTEGGPQGPIYPASPERLEIIIERIIMNHLKAFTKTPAALNIHAAEYNAGLDVFEKGLCWARRDSFQTAFRTMEASIAQGLKPGGAMVWEQTMPGRSFPSDKDFNNGRSYLLPQRYFDVQAHYIGIGFNPWVNIWAHENCLKSLEFIEQNIGYRIRPSMVLNRQIGNKNDLVICLRNDGCSPPPGVITLTAHFPDGKNGSVTIPMGEPAPGALKTYAIPLHKNISEFGQNGKITLSMNIKMREKIKSVQWAVKKTNEENGFILDIPTD